MNEKRGYVPDNADEFAMPPPDEHLNHPPEEIAPEPGPSTEENQEQETPGRFDPIMDLMRSLGRSKWLMTFMLGGGISGMAYAKTREYRELHQAEHVVAEQRATLEHQRATIGQRQRHLQEVFGERNPFSSIGYESLTVAANEQGLAETKKNIHWYSRPEQISPPRDPFEFQHRGQETVHSLVATDLRGRDPIFNRESQIPADSLKSILQHDFPKGWVDGEIDSVKQINEIISMPKHYGINDIEVAHCATGPDGRSTIVLSGGIQQESLLYTTQELLPHEIAHANDWRSDREMAYEERVTLLDDIAQRIDAPDRWKSYYVESIHNENIQKQRITRATEYWAEICATYFHTPTLLNKKDFDIVDRMIRRTDPTFNVRHSINHRADIVLGLKSAQHPAK